MSIIIPILPTRVRSAVPLRTARALTVTFLMVVFWFGRLSHTFGQTNDRSDQITAGLTERNEEEEHESNGPEGSQGVPMQRLPAGDTALAIAVLISGGWLVVRSGQANKTGKYRCESN